MADGGDLEMRSAGATDLAEVRSQIGWHLRKPWGRVIGPLLLAAPAIGGPLWLTLSLLAVGALLTVLSDYAVHLNLRRLRSAKAKGLRRDIAQYLIETADIIDTMAQKQGGKIRANVMLPADGGVKATIITTGYSKAEESVLWRRGEGCVGHAWADGKVHRWPSGDSDLDQKLVGSLNAEQRACTSGVKMVVAVPIFWGRNASRNPDREPDELVAVVCVDDTLPPGDSVNTIVSAAQKLADQVASRLRDLQSP